MSSRRNISSKSHKANQPRVTFVQPTNEEYDPTVLKENIPPVNEISNSKSKKATASLASKFSKRWEHLATYDVPIAPIQIQCEQPIHTEVSMQDGIPVIEIPNDISDEQPTQPVQRIVSNQSAESILQDIDVLVNKVKEICAKKEKNQQKP